MQSLLLWQGAASGGATRANRHTQAVELAGGEGANALFLQPMMEQQSTGGFWQKLEWGALQAAFTTQLFNGQGGEGALAVLHLRHPLAELGDALAASWMQRLQHRKHLVADAVAAEGRIGIRWIKPNGQVQVLTDLGGVVSTEAQKGAHQPRAAWVIVL